MKTHSDIIQLIFQSMISSGNRNYILIETTITPFYPVIYKKITGRVI